MIVRPSEWRPRDTLSLSRESTTTVVLLASLGLASRDQY